MCDMVLSQAEEHIREEERKRDEEEEEQSDNEL